MARRPGYAKELNDKWRKAALLHYGARCVCCGEEEQAFLEFDHVNNDGWLERRTFSHPTVRYRRLALDPIRDDLQILCANCNKGKARNGVCPHQR